MILAWMATPAAQATAYPVFDCKQASNTVEQAICRNKSLTQQNRQINLRYQRILNSRPAIVEPSFFIASQRHWLKHKYIECTQAKALSHCLLQRMQSRNQQLASLLNGQAASSINMAIAMIPKQPALAAQQLRRYPDDALASAWLAYMGYYSPNSGVSASERQAVQDKVVNTLTERDDFLGEALELDKQKTAQGVFYLLRAAYDGSSNTEAYSDGCPQYFIFYRHDKAAFDAFGPQYGSSRDARAPYCFPYNDFYNLPQWQQLKQSLYAPIALAYNHTGSMRYASFAHFAAVSLRMSVFPQQYATSLAYQQKTQAIYTLQNWSYATVWGNKERKYTLQLIPAVEQATMQWLVKHHGLSPQLARKAASGIVGTYLNLWVNWLAEPQ